MKSSAIFTILVILCFCTIPSYSQEGTKDYNLTTGISSSYTPEEHLNLQQKTTKEDPIISFGAPNSNVIGIDYDPVRDGIWVACEYNSTFLIDKNDGSVIRELDLTGIAIVPEAFQNGVHVLPSGNLLFTDFRGNGGTALNDYLFEVNPDTEELINFWPLSGAANTSTDGTSITDIIDVAVDDNGVAYLTSLSTNFIYRINLEPGKPGTWTTLSTLAAPSTNNIIGIDYFCGHWVISDYTASTDVVILDETYTPTASFTASHDGNYFNSGVCLIEGTTPSHIAVTDWTTASIAVFNSNETLAIPPSITAINGEKYICPGDATELEINGALGDATEWTWYTGSCGGSMLHSGPTFSTPSVDESLNLYVAGTGGCFSIPLECEEVTITAEDVIDPIITCPGTMQVSADDNGTYTVSGTECDLLEITDNCDTESVCSNNYNSLSSLNGAVFPTGTTIVTWEVTDASGNYTNCMFSLRVVEDNSIDDLLAAGIKIFPNPSGGLFRIEHDLNESIIYEIRDVRGALVYLKKSSQQNLAIDLTHEPAGIYFIKVLVDKNVYSAKLLLR